LAALVLTTAPWALLLILVPAATVFGVYRAYMRATASRSPGVPLRGQKYPGEPSGGGGDLRGAARQVARGLPRRIRRAHPLQRRAHRAEDLAHPHRGPRGHAPD